MDKANAGMLKKMLETVYSFDPGTPNAVVCTMGEYLDNNMDDFLTVQAFLVPKYSDSYLKRKRTELGYNGFLVDNLERERKIEYRLYHKDGRYRTLKKRVYDYMLDRIDWQKYEVSFEERDFDGNTQIYEFMIIKASKGALQAYNRESDGDLDKKISSVVETLLRIKGYSRNKIINVLKITPIDKN